MLLLYIRYTRILAHTDENSLFLGSGICPYIYLGDLWRQWRSRNRSFS